MKIKPVKNLMPLSPVEDWMHHTQWLEQEKEELERFVASLGLFRCKDGVSGVALKNGFKMFDSDGNSVASGADAMDAWQNFQEENQND